jgi:tetratricopeptide (TPR) repeat protein
MKRSDFTDTAIGGYFGAAAYLVFVVLVFVFAVRQGLSSYSADAAFRDGTSDDARAAADRQPGNPEAVKILGIAYLREQDYGSAAAAFERAVSLRENDFLMWLRLGFARFKQDDLAGAESAYRRSLELAPNYSQPNYYLGKLLVGAGRPDEGFRYLSKAADLDNSLFPEVLHRARIAYSDNPAAIENAIRPETPIAKLTLARYFINHTFTTPALSAFLTGGELDADEKDEFVRELIATRQFALARDVWASKNRSETIGALPPLYDGGFEKITASDPSGLGWQIDPKISATEITRIERDVHSGSAALKIKYSGPVELRAKIISQISYVEPRRKYKLKFAYRSSEMITAGLPAIIVSDAASDQQLGSSVPLRPTGEKWVESEIEFTSTDLPVVVVSLQRPTCQTNPCPIFGDLSIDDFTITEN